MLQFCGFVGADGVGWGGAMVMLAGLRHFDWVGAMVFGRACGLS